MKTNITIARIAPFIAITAFPLLTLAVSNLCELVSLAVYYFNVAIYMIIALATVIFIWNVYKYFFKADIENKKEAGLYVMYSIIGFFVILSFWGLVNIVKNTFNLDNSVPSSLSGGFGTGGGSSGCSGGGSGTPNAGGASNGAGSFAAGNTGGSNANSTQDVGIITSLYNALLGGWGKDKAATGGTTQ